MSLFAEFSLGVSLILKRWTALQLCIEHDLAGVNSALKQTELYENIVEYFKDDGIKVDVDELENSLFWYFQDTFELEIDDDSTKDVAERLVRLFKEVCVEGNVTEVERLKKIVENSTMDNVKNSQYVVEHAEEEVEDQEMQEPSRKSEPIIDEDGFELVQKGRGKKH